MPNMILFRWIGEWYYLLTSACVADIDREAYNLVLDKFSKKVPNSWVYCWRR